MEKIISKNLGTIGLLVAAMLLLPATSGLAGITWTPAGTNSSWEYGTNTAGSTVWATGLEVPHNREECSWIESTTLPGAIFEDDALMLHHTVDLQDADIGWQYAIDGGLVVISKDDGSTWTKVPMDYPVERLPASPPQWEGIRPCISEMIGEDEWNSGYFSGEAENLTSNGNVGEIGLTDNVKIRLVFFADHASTVELIGGELGRDGWQIHGVNLGGVDLMPFLGVDTGNLPSL